jgi:outer membrane protein insertion porin family
MCKEASGMKSLWIAILLTLAAVATISAQSQGDKDTTSAPIVERVDIRGNRRITGSEIKSFLSTRKQSVYQPQRLDRDVRTLYETGHFDDVKVYVENGLHGGKIVTFEVSDRPLIIDVVYEGIDSSQQEEVVQELSRQKIDLSGGSEYDPARLKLAAKIIQEVLTKQNQSVKVNPIVERHTASDVLVIFKAESGSQR